MWYSRRAFYFDARGIQSALNTSTELPIWSSLVMEPYYLSGLIETALHYLRENIFLSCLAALAIYSIASWINGLKRRVSPQYIWGLRARWKSLGSTYRILLSFIGGQMCFARLSAAMKSPGKDTNWYFPNHIISPIVSQKLLPSQVVQWLVGSSRSRSF